MNPSVGMMAPSYHEMAPRSLHEALYEVDGAPFRTKAADLLTKDLRHERR
jgi:hypothetical protein